MRCDNAWQTDDSEVFLHYNINNVDTTQLSVWVMSKRSFCICRASYSSQINRSSEYINVCCGGRLKKGQGSDVYFPRGNRSVKITKHLVISLMSFVALSDHTWRVSTVNGENCNYSQSNYSFQFYLKDEMYAVWWWLMSLPRGWQWCCWC